ncbi:MAG: barstar family protein [Saprospiraceae bacterium]|nr:barstar family protein [Saprospiraceae bacterium]
MKLKTEMIVLHDRESLQKLALENHSIFWWNGQKAKSWSDLIHLIAKSLEFPEYFGSNQDALYDGLLDLAWIPNSNILIVIEHFEKILCDELITEPDAPSELLLLLQDVVTEWRHYAEVEEANIPKKNITFGFINSPKLKETFLQNNIEFREI